MSFTFISDVGRTLLSDIVGGCTKAPLDTRVTTRLTIPFVDAPTRTNPASLSLSKPRSVSRTPHAALPTPNAVIAGSALINLPDRLHSINWLFAFLSNSHSISNRFYPIYSETNENPQTIFHVSQTRSIKLNQSNLKIYLHKILIEFEFHSEIFR